MVCFEKNSQLLRGKNGRVMIWGVVLRLTVTVSLWAVGSYRIWPKYLMLYLSWCFSLLSGLSKPHLECIRTLSWQLFGKKQNKTLLENILLSKYSILQKYKMFHGSVCFNENFSGKTFKGLTGIIREKEKRRENYSLGNSDAPICVQPGCGGDLYFMSAYLSASPISLSLVRGVLWCEWFTILWSKELLCKSGVRFLMSIIEARIPLGVK